jgi:hypothetical protein
VTTIVWPYYNDVPADCAARLSAPVARGAQSTVSSVMIRVGASLDGARQVAKAMEWLRRNGYHELLANVWVINHVAPGNPRRGVEDLVQQFERHPGGGRALKIWDWRRLITAVRLPRADTFDTPGERSTRRVLAPNLHEYVAHSRIAQMSARTGHLGISCCHPRTLRGPGPTRPE